MKNGADNSCSFNEQILAYVYDELPASGRDEFESHLELCFGCIDELAEMADARYSVYEWKNVEFTPLATPRIAIPAANGTQASWLSSIKAAFQWNNGWALSAGMAAVVLLGLVGFFLRSIEITVPAETAGTVKVPSSVGPIDRLEPEVSRAVETPNSISDEPVAVDRPTRTHTTARMVLTAKPARAKRAQTAVVAKSSPSQRLQGSPTLGYYAEDSDESLRLTDLFDDVGTRELD